MPKKKTTNKALSAAQKKKINDFYIQNGWKDTLSKFKLSPPQGSKIITKKSKKEWQKGQDEIKEAAKAKRKAEREAAKAKRKAEREAAKAKKAKKKAAKKKAKAPKKKAAKKSTKKKAKAPKKKPGRPKGSKKTTRAKGPTKRKATSIKSNADAGDVLDFLLSYREREGKHAMHSLDSVIIDLATQVRRAS